MSVLSTLEAAAGTVALLKDVTMPIPLQLSAMRWYSSADDDNDGDSSGVGIDDDDARDGTGTCSSRESGSKRRRRGSVDDVVCSDAPTPPITLVAEERVAAKVAAQVPGRHGSTAELAVQSVPVGAAASQVAAGIRSSMQRAHAQYQAVAAMVTSTPTTTACVSRTFAPLGLSLHWFHRSHACLHALWQVSFKRALVTKARALLCLLFSSESVLDDDVVAGVNAPIRDSMATLLPPGPGNTHDAGHVPVDLDSVILRCRRVLEHPAVVPKLRVSLLRRAILPGSSHSVVAAHVVNTGAEYVACRRWLSAHIVGCAVCARHVA